MMQRQIISKAGVDTELALELYKQASAAAAKKASIKAEMNKEKYAVVIKELTSALHLLLDPDFSKLVFNNGNDIFYTLQHLNSIINEFLSSSSDICKAYYSPAEISKDLSVLLQSLDSEHHLYSAQDVAAALNQLLLVKQQVPYADEEIREELLALIDPVLMNMCNDLLEKHDDFYQAVVNWAPTLEPEDIQKCALVQQVLMDILGNVKEINQDITTDECILKITEHRENVIKQMTIKSQKNQNYQMFPEYYLFRDKIEVMQGMIDYVKDLITLSQLQLLASDYYLYCKGVTSTTSKLLMNVIAFKSDSNTLALFKKTQPILNRIAKYSETVSGSNMNSKDQILNVLLALKYHLTDTPYVIIDGKPSLKFNLNQELGSLREVIQLNPHYKTDAAISQGLFSKKNKDVMNKLLSSIHEVKPLFTKTQFKNGPK